MKRLVRIAAVIVVLLLLVAVALPFLIDANRFRPMLEAELTRALAREVHIGDLKVSLWSGGATASDISIADDARFQKAPFVKAASLSIGVKWMPPDLLSALSTSPASPSTNRRSCCSKTRPVTGTTPRSAIRVRQKPAATPAGKQDQPLALSVSKVNIRDGRVTLGKDGRAHEAHRGGQVWMWSSPTSPPRQRSRSASRPASTAPARSSSRDNSVPSTPTMPRRPR